MVQIRRYIKCATYIRTIIRLFGIRHKEQQQEQQQQEQQQLLNS